MKKLFNLKAACLILIIMLFTSCKTVSKFTSESINIGMSKEQIISRFGQPYKYEVTKDKETGALEESLFYRESYELGYYSIINILNFKDGKLVSLKQGEESTRNNHTTIKKDSR
ncbi:DUF2845 domain-containing protein [Elizabethkingia anophelis]|uniref:DUF2845 domain-containing protein n=1 Tax=Elizabethkingia anophelis TaxID=1117645 RepID=UPI0024E220E3|nr:DUF2845 domain-containing protein [Elizabethkingia anophelis]CAH1139439.1 hypothetical protein EAVVTKC53_00212 [Elizabethkingia anophelis]CAI9686664.1 hypothetical protein EAVVTKC53_03451 [Elizabethkingia anophelis]